MKIEDLCPYEENISELVNKKALKRRDFERGIAEIENEILQKAVRSIEEALMDDPSDTTNNNMNAGNKAVKRKIHSEIESTSAAKREVRYSQWLEGVPDERNVYDYEVSK